MLEILARTLYPKSPTTMFACGGPTADSTIKENKMKKKRVKEEKSTQGITKVVGIVDPEDFPAGSETVVEVRSYSQGTMFAGPIHLNKSGVFVLELNAIPKLEELLRSNDIEVRVVDREGHVLAQERLKAFAGQTLIGVKLHSAQRALGKESQPQVTEVSEIFPQRAISYLATKVAKVQGVDVQRAQAPRPVLTAISQLNRVGRLAARSLAGERKAEEIFLQALGETAAGNPGGAPRWPSDLAGPILTTLVNFGADGFPARGCAPTITRAMEILKAGSVIDIGDRNRDGRWTRMARAYIGHRLQIISSYVESVEQALREPKGQLSGYPIGDKGFMGPIVQPETPESYSPEPYPEELPGIPCELIAEICMSLSEEAVSTYIGEDDPISSVEPNCLCYGYDPAQEFVARPVGGTFPSDVVVETSPGTWWLAPGKDLFFNYQRITAAIVDVNQYEIRFNMPPEFYNQSGIVTLSRLIPSIEGVDPRVIELACGVSLPDVPAIIPRSSQARISVIYPPVFDLFSVKGIPDQWPEERCIAPMELCWRAHLADQSVGDSIHRCGSIEVIIRDNDGTYVASGGSSGCVKVNIDRDRMYVAEATSFTGQQF
jgi:hypothetical protein